jgi:conjugal transfer mating pair stabilization protein TraG
MFDTPFIAISYGNGHILNAVINAIAGAMDNSSGFKSILHLMMLFGFIVAIYTMMAKGNPKQLLLWLISGYILYSVLIVQKMPLLVHDRISKEYFSIDRVPLGLGVFASIASQTGDALTQLFEKFFSLPDDLQYSHSGFLMAAKVASQSQQVQISNPQLRQDLNRFMQRCVFYDLLLHRYSLEELKQQADVWQFIKNNTSKTRRFSYQDELPTCKDGVKKLDIKLQQEIAVNSVKLGKEFFHKNTKQSSKTREQSSQQNNLTTTAIESSSLQPIHGDKFHEAIGEAALTQLASTIQYLAGVSQTAGTMMKQALIGNAMHNALMQQAAQVDSAASLALYSNTRANALLLTKFQGGADLALTWLPVMKNVMQALLYGGFMLMAVLMFLPGGFTSVKGYLKTLMWIELWSPLYAVLHLVMLEAAKYSSMVAVGDAANAAITLNNYLAFADTNAAMVMYAGYATLSIPLIAWGLVNGGDMAVTTLASGLSGIVQQATGRVAEEATSGNISLRNIQYDTQYAFNSSANHFDHNARFQAGAISEQLPGGSVATINADGAQTLDVRGAISHLPLSNNLTKSLRSGVQQQIDATEQTALQQYQQYNQQVAAAIRNVDELATQVTSSEATADTDAINQSTNINHSLADFHNITSRFAANNNISQDHANRFIARAYADANVSFNTDSSIFTKPISMLTGASLHGKSGVGVEGDNSDSSQDQMLYQKALDYVAQSNFSEHFNQTLNSLHDNQYRSGDEKIDRLAEQAVSSYDESEQSNSSMQALHQRSNALHDLANMVKEDGLQTTLALDQSFYSWFLTQSTPDGGNLTAASIEQIMLHNPDLATQYAEQFLADKVATMTANYAENSAEIAAKPLQSSLDNYSGHTTLQDSYQQASSSLAKHDISKQHEAQKQQIYDQAKQKDLDLQQPISSQIKDQSIELQGEIQSKMGDRKYQIKQKINETKNDISTKGKFKRMSQNIDVGEINNWTNYSKFGYEWKDYTDPDGKNYLPDLSFLKIPSAIGNQYNLTKSQPHKQIPVSDDETTRK